MSRLRLRESGGLLLEQFDCERLRHIVFISKSRRHVNLARHILA
jgi:hypothetical protein